MTCTDFACILGIVSEILIVKTAVVIADKTIAFYVLGIEFQLHFNIACNCIKSAVAFFNQNLCRFCSRVYIMIASVSVVCKSFKLVVLEISVTKAEGSKIYARFTLLFNKLLQFTFTGNANVKVTVSCDDYAVVSAFNEIMLGNIISCIDTALAVGAAACLKRSSHGFDSIDLIALCTCQNNVFFARIGYD